MSRPSQPSGKLVVRAEARLGVGRELGRRHDVDRQLDLEVERAPVAQLLGHLAADEHRVGPAAEVAQDAELVLDLRAAGDEHERALDLAEQPAEVLELGQEQQARVGRQQVRDRLGRGVRAMRRAERVVDVEVAALGELAREALVVRSSRPGRSACSRARGRARPAGARAAAPRPAPSRTSRGPPRSSAGRDASRRAPLRRPARAGAAASAARRGCGCRRRRGRPRAARSGRRGPARSCPRRRRRGPSAARASLLPTPRRQPAASAPIFSTRSTRRQL